MRLLFLFSFFLLILVRPGLTQDMAQPYAFLYIAKDLPDKRIQAMVQDNRGFVWIATFNGLFRYDGLRYKLFKNAPGLADKISFNHIGQMHLYQDRFLILEGTRQLNIWDLLTEKVISTSPPELIFKQSILRGGQCYFHFEDTELNSVFFTLSPDGHLEKIAPFLPPGMRMENAVLDDMGQIWFFDKSGFFWSLDPVLKKITPVDTVSYAKRRLLHLPDLYCDPENQIWAFDNAHPQYNGMYILSAKGPKKSGELTNKNTLIRQSGTGKLYIYNIESSLLSEFDTKLKTMMPIMTLPAELNNIHLILKDRQDNLWIASQYVNHNGILLVHPHITAFQKFLFQDGKQQSIGMPCRGIAELKTGEILAGGQEGIFIWNPQTDETKLLPITISDREIESRNIWKIITDPDGKRVWFTKEEGGIFEYSFENKYARNYIIGGEVSNRALGMTMDDQGMIWMGTRSGINFFDTRTRTYLHGSDTLKQFYDVNGYDWIQTDPENIWLCSSNGLYQFNPKTRQLRRRYGTDTEPFLYSDEVFDIIRNGKAYWIATDNGLHKLEDNIITRYTTEQGLAHDVVAGISTDEDGNLWITTFNGLSKMDIATGDFQNFYVEDGLPHNEFNRVGKWKSSDGQLYFSSQNGVVHFNPDEVTKEVPVYDLVLTGFSTFNKDGRLEKKKVDELQRLKIIEIPAGNKYFQVEFALLNFINSTDNRYSYYLEGLEDTWHPLSTLPMIQYNNLPAGSYTLHIRAVSPSGHRSKNTLDLEMIVKQHFYQTFLFRLILIIGVFSIAFGVLRNRIIQRLHMERMRNRISSDLHDEVGGVLSGIAMQMDLLETRSPDHLKPFMQRIAESSRNAAMKMRDVIWSLDSSKDHFQDLIDRMKAYTLELLVPFNIAHRFDSRDIDPQKKLNVDARQNMYLIFKEAMNNIIKHAEASEVEIKLEEKKNTIIMTVTDNGKGFSENLISKGQGLNNMAKRTKRIGGQLDITTNEKGGTTVRLTLSI